VVTHEELLLEAMRASPDDAGPRLVYADWLLTRGDARGELIILEHRERTTAGGIIAPELLLRFVLLAAEHGFSRLPGDPDGDLLPFTGGGSHPVQYEVDHTDGRHYYLRWRHGGFSIDVDDEPVLDTELDVEHDSDWTHEETNVILALVSDAIRSGLETVAKLVFPAGDAMRSHPRYRAGPHPFYVLPEELRARFEPETALQARDRDRWHALWRRLNQLPERR
jgi:uncharacterized protein (TIGR02996 family)